MASYYNELDPFAAQWLRHLIVAGHIAPGDVDERSIVDVRADDLRGYTQCHFFAGIGVWSHALRNAGWSDDRSVWTGSCPCQPFSDAGKGQGFDDARHLWPTWFRLIEECGPVAVFGEQVASSDGLAWLDHVCSDMESASYTIGAVDTCAAGYGAPHIRQRLYFVADAGNRRCEIERASRLHGDGQPGHDTTRRGEACELGNASVAGRERQSVERPARSRREGPAVERAGAISAVNGFWRDAEWIACSDGKARPVKPGIFPLATGVAARVGKLRAAGNSIVAPQATAFVEAYMSIA